MVKYSPATTGKGDIFVDTYLNIFNIFIVKKIRFKKFALRKYLKKSEIFVYQKL
jgi:hypothetical protein